MAIVDNNYYYYCHITTKSSNMSVDNKLVDHHQERRKEGKNSESDFCTSFRKVTYQQPFCRLYWPEWKDSFLLFYGGHYAHSKEILKFLKAYLFLKFWFWIVIFLFPKYASWINNFHVHQRSQDKKIIRWNLWRQAWERTYYETVSLLDWDR